MIWKRYHYNTFHCRQDIPLLLLHIFRKMLSLSPTFSSGIVSSCEVAPEVKIVTLQRHNVGLSKKIVIIENKIKLHLCCEMPDLRAIELHISKYFIC